MATSAGASFHLFRLFRSLFMLSLWFCVIPLYGSKRVILSIAHLHTFVKFGEILSLKYVLNSSIQAFCSSSSLPNFFSSVLSKYTAQMVLIATCFCFRATLFCQPSPTILQYVVPTPGTTRLETQDMTFIIPTSPSLTHAMCRFGNFIISFRKLKNISWCF